MFSMGGAFMGKIHRGLSELSINNFNTKSHDTQTVYEE